MNQRFPKAQRLKSKKVIAQLFEEGKSFTKFPVKVFYLQHNNFIENQAAFAVPKKNFKLAVTRNKLKRQMREAYRLQKINIEGNTSTKFAVLFLYLGKTQAPYAKLEKSIGELLKKLSNETN